MAIRIRNLKKEREYNKKYNDNLPVEIKKERNKAKYIRLGPEEYKRRAREWQLRNPHLVHAYSHENNIKRRYPVVWANKTIERNELVAWLIKNKGGPCYFCGEPSTDIDHKTPLSKGGAHSWENIHLLCHACNFSKQDLTVEEFLEKIKIIYEKFFHNN